MRRLLNWLTGRTSPSPTQTPTALRNRAGGMAWVRGLGEVPGDQVLNNRAVKTVRLVEEGMWLIEPPQQWRAELDVILRDGSIALAGDMLTSTAIADECLEPWKEDGVREEDVRELFEAPPARVKAPATPVSSLRGH